MSPGKPEYVSDLVVYLLKRLGVEYVTLNPGATTRGMHQSLVTYGGNTAPEVITCSHEEVAVAMAEGYYLATRRPQATLVHYIVGLQHARGPSSFGWACKNTGSGAGRVATAGSCPQISLFSGAGLMFCESSPVCARAQWTAICNGGAPRGPRGPGRSTRLMSSASRRT